ncbi:MAG TPA: hypothetical protein VLV18_07265 [Terriglobales bacterium]|nr:hypothetical protein [Terriglobales bacterium]
MSKRSERIRECVQKLTEAIWNLDQLEPLDPELKAQYSSIQETRRQLMEQLKKELDRS